MSLFNRKTQFWQDPTPAKLGPGSYQLSKSRQDKQSSAPFSKSQKRSMSAPRAEVRSLPGPGQYSFQQSLGKHIRTSSNYQASKSPRLLPFAPGVTGFVLPSNYGNPGPGTYLTQTDANFQYSSRQKVRHSSVVVQPSPASIPSSSMKKGQLGPTSYKPQIQQTKPNAPSTKFGSYKGKRNVFSASHQGEPGPGAYQSQNMKQDRQSWVFSSSNFRQLNIEKSEQPGPGQYNTEGGNNKPSVTVEGFGSTTRKDIPTTADPHRPFVVGAHPVPPLGTYNTQEQIFKQKTLKQKFVSFDIPIKKAAFNISDRRRVPWQESQNPGPGEYYDTRKEPDTDNGSSFGSKANRFQKKKPGHGPGPGSYQTRAVKSAGKLSSNFKSKTPRFKSVASDNFSVVVLGNQQNLDPYLVHQAWNARQTRALDATHMNPRISFDTSTNRGFFVKEKQVIPGPGSYQVRPQTVPSKPLKLTSNRFDSHGSYNLKKGTTREVGPGSYHKNDEQVKKSFNMVGELGREKPWL